MTGNFFRINMGLKTLKLAKNLPENPENPEFGSEIWLDTLLSQKAIISLIESTKCSIQCTKSRGLVIFTSKYQQTHFGYSSGITLTEAGHVGRNYRR